MSATLRIAVTGGAGFIGSHVVERLVERGHAVLVVDDLSHPCGAVLPDGADLVEADAGSAHAAMAISRFRPDAAIHLAAKGGVARALREPAEHVRSVLASSVAFFAAAGQAGVRAVVAASSGGAVYGDAELLPTAETTPPAPRSPYGAEKLAEEGYLGAAGRVFGYRTLSLRYGNVYGPRQDGTGEAGVVAISCHRLLAGEAPRIFGDGGQTRDFVYAGDVADATVAALLSDVAGVLNVGTGRSTSVEQVVTTLCDAAGSGAAIEHLEGRAGEVRDGRLDITSIASLLRWTPQTDIDTGLRATFAWFAENATAASGVLNRKTA